MPFLTRRDLNLDDVLTMALRVGEVNIRAMQLLDQANTGAYGHPVLMRVRVTPVKGKAILVSGHDFRDRGHPQANRGQGHQRTPTARCPAP